MIYLDYAAHAPADPAVLERFCDMERRFPANPNSVHAAGKAAREEMARVTEQIAALTGASPAEVIFTSGATEANNLAIKGIAQASRHIGKHIISTPLEHSSVSGSLTALQERGWEIDLLSIGRDGTVDPEEVRELLRPDTVLVAICAVDSELGTIQPVNEIAALLADHPNAVCTLTQRRPSGASRWTFWHRHAELCAAQVRRHLRQRRAAQAQPDAARTANERRCQHDAVPQRHARTRSGGFVRTGTAAGMR